MLAGGAEEAKFLNLYQSWPRGLALAPEPSVISGYQPRDMNLAAVNSWPGSGRNWNPGLGQASAIPPSVSYVATRLQLPCYRRVLGSVDATVLDAVVGPPCGCGLRAMATTR